MTQPSLFETITFLARTPGALNATLRDLPDAWTHRNEGDGSDARARLILEHGESRAFEPFDIMGHKRPVFC
jgi:hypothetical protein